MTGKTAATPLDDQSEAIRTLEKAWQQSRAIIPLLGAGISAETGYPVVTAIVHYLAKVRAYISTGAYLPRRNGSSDRFLDHALRKYRSKPEKYIERHGWPDQFRINEDLWHHLKSSNEIDQKPLATSIGEMVASSLDSLVEREYPKPLDRLVRLVTDAAKGKGLSAAELKSAMEETKLRLRKDLSESYWSANYGVLVDWKELIRYATNFKPYLADALFQRFQARRAPGKSHQFLAFLAKFLGLRLILTFNFDPFIETALQLEGIAHTVFEMEQGAELPRPAHLQGQLSVVKMHGSTHALLLDERLEYPLTKGYKDDFDKLARHIGAATGTPPLLVVAGCSESDRRVRDLVEHSLGRQRRSGECTVIWLHYEKNPPNFLGSLRREHREGVLTARVLSPGAFFSHWYEALTTRHPAGRTTYAPYNEYPSGLSNRESTEKPRGNCFHFAPGTDRAGRVSHALAHFVNEQAGGDYFPIWIDLESQYTLAGVVGSIIDQCRRYDPGLAPAVLPLDDESWELAIQKGSRLVANALCRSRYILAFDGLETFAWHPTVHHGVLNEALQRDRKLTLTRQCIRLIAKIVEYSRTYESLVCFAYDVPKARRFSRDPWDPTATDRFDHDSELYTDIQDEINNDEHLRKATTVPATSEEYRTTSLEKLNSGPPILRHLLVDIHDRTLLPDEFKALLDERSRRLMLSYISTFRRTRTLTALRRILSEVIFSGDSSGIRHAHEVDDLLAALVNGGLLSRTEGGAFWMDRTERDRVYALNSYYTSTAFVKDPAGLVTTQQALAAASQLTLLSQQHRRIGQYYRDAFMMSKNHSVFFEQIYHYTSAARFLTRLAHLLLSREEEFFGQFRRCWAELFVDFKHIEGPLDETLQSFGRRIGEQRLAIVSALRQAWRDAEIVIRSSVPSEQIVAWCRWMIEQDLDRFVVDESPPPTPPRPLWFTEMEDRIKQRVLQYEETLRDLWVCSLYERRDFASVKTGRADLPAIDRCGYSDLYRHLDVAACPTAPEGKSDIVTSVVSRLDELRKEKSYSESHDAYVRLRAKYIRCWSYLQACLPWTGKWWSVDLATFFNGTAKGKDEILKQTEEGLRLSEGIGPKPADLPTDPWIGSDTGGTSALCYTSLFHLLRGRAWWLGASERKEVQFERAYREIELSSVVVHGGDRLLMAVPELYRAEACLVHARHMIAPGLNQGREFTDPIAKATVKLAACRQALRRAKENLLLGRRNVIWWRRFFLLSSLYHSDEVSLALLRAAVHPREPKIAGLEQTVSAVYGEIQSSLWLLKQSLDLNLQDTTDERRGAKRVWEQLLVWSIAFWLKMNQYAGIDSATGEQQEDLLWRWKWLNRSAGLEALFVNGQVFDWTEDKLRRESKRIHGCKKEDDSDWFGWRCSLIVK